jgi:hypothetical protein
VTAALVVGGCGGSDLPSPKPPPAGGPVQVVRAGQMVPELRGRTVGDARRLLQARTLRLVGRARPTCLVVQQSPAPGGRTRDGRVRAWTDCRHPSGSCGFAPGVVGIEIVVRAGGAPCSTARRLFVRYSARAGDQAQGNGAYVPIGEWGCGRLPPGGEMKRRFVAFTSCTRRRPAAQVVFVER